MNAEIFSEWLRLQDFRIIRTDSSYWFEARPRIYQAFPYHWLINPALDELSEFISRNRVLGLRYSTSLNESIGCISYHAIYEGPDYKLANLGKWARKNVRHGLSHCIVEPISFEVLSEKGWFLHVDTLIRQGRSNGLTPEVWRILCHSAASLPGFTAWGAFVDRYLAASVITFQMDDWAYMLYQQCNHEYLSKHVNNALSFVVTKQLLDHPGIKSILYGLHSLDAPPSVDDFKFRMGYKAKPVRQRVVFNQTLSIVTNPLTHGLLIRILRYNPGNSTLSKTEGMLRFYLEGKKALEKQVWPEILAEQREAILLKLRQVPPESIS